MNGLYVIVGFLGVIGQKLCGIILQRGGTPLLVGQSAEKLQAINDELNSNCQSLPSPIPYQDWDCPLTMQQLPHIYYPLNHPASWEWSCSSIDDDRQFLNSYYENTVSIITQMCKVEKKEDMNMTEAISSSFSILYLQRSGCRKIVLRGWCKIVICVV
jgi:hypothetical protein